MKQYIKDLSILLILCSIIIIPIMILNSITKKQILHQISAQQTHFDSIYSKIQVSHFYGEEAKEEVIQFVMKYNIEHPDIVVKQTILESGWFRSDLYLNHNNCLGMMFPTTRSTTAIGKTKSGFAIYKSLEDCILDYKYWQDRYCKNLSRIEYYNYIGKVYAEDKSYISKLKNIKL